MHDTHRNTSTQSCLSLSLSLSLLIRQTCFLQYLNSNLYGFCIPMTFVMNFFGCFLANQFFDTENKYRFRSMQNTENLGLPEGAEFTYIACMARVTNMLIILYA